MAFLKLTQITVSGETESGDIVYQAFRLSADAPEHIANAFRVHAVEQFQSRYPGVPRFETRSDDVLIEVDDE